MPTTQKINWDKVVADSNGTAIFLPEKFVKDAEEVERLRKEFNSKVGEMAEREITMNMATQNMFFALRKYLSENGHTDIWQKDIGFNVEALNDGKFVVNLMDVKAR
jgi:hypothetical protein